MLYQVEDGHRQRDREQEHRGSYRDCVFESEELFRKDIYRPMNQIESVGNPADIDGRRNA
jgi:hypothetical protein